MTAAAPFSDAPTDPDVPDVRPEPVGPDDTDDGPEGKYRVAPDLVRLLIPVDQLEDHPENPRVGDVDEIKASLRRHGQYAPVLFQTSRDRLLKGHHVRQAARELGWTHVAALGVDVQDDQARRILVADNRLSERGRSNDEVLAELLQSIAATEQGLDGTGYDDGDLRDLLASLAPPDLDDLVDDHGDLTDDDLLVRVSFRVSEDVASTWKAALRATGETSDTAQAARLVELAYAAATRGGDPTE